jgi:hypothetical protein
MTKAHPESAYALMTPQGRRRAARRRALVRLLIGIGIYTVVGFWVLPMVVRTVAVSQLKDALGREVTIAKVRFNPYTFVGEIHGLAIQDRDGPLLAGWDRVRVNFQLTSIFHGPWRLKEVVIERLQARVQINPDYSFNFSDLLEKFAGEGEPVESKEPGPYPRIQIDEIRMAGATVEFTDLTPSQPFRRQLGPVELHVSEFSTLPGHINHLTVQATTDAGERIAWESQLWLDPLRLTGSLELEGLGLTDYKSLYQDFLQVEVRGGTVDVNARYDLQFDPQERVARISDSRIRLAGFRVGVPGAETNLVELDQLEVGTELLDAWERQVRVQNVLIDGVRVTARRLADEQLDWVELAQPPATVDRAPGSAVYVAEAFTNAFALFSGSTNAAVVVVQEFDLTGGALGMVDEVPARAAHVEMSDLTVRARGLSNRQDATPELSVSLRVQTNGTLSLNASATVSPPAVELGLELRDLDLGVLDSYLAGHANVSLLNSRFALTGRGRLEAVPGREPTGHFEGGLALESLHTAHSLEDHDLLTFDGFRIEGITASLHPLDVAIERVELVAPELWAILNGDGTLNFFTAAKVDRPLIGAAATSASEVVEVGTPVSDPSVDPPMSSVPPVRLASFVVTNATMNLLDRMAEPAVALTITNFHGEFRDLSSTNLQHGDFAFEGRIQSGGTFEIQGQVRPMDSGATTRAHLVLSDMELTPGSPYTARFLGYRLAAGKVTTDLAYEITGGQLQATNHILLDRFTLGTRVESPDALKVPIRLGLALLQDRQGRIDLTIPVSGSLDDPQFSLAGVIRGAFANVFTRLFTSPFGMLGSMFGGGGEDADLQEVLFEPGSVALDGRSAGRVRKLEEILYERPGLRLVLRGTVDESADNTLAWRRAHLAERLQEGWPESAAMDSVARGEPVAVPFAEPEYRAAVERAYRWTVSGSEQEPALEEEPPMGVLATPIASVGSAPALMVEPVRVMQRPARGGQVLLRNRPSTATARRATMVQASTDPMEEPVTRMTPPPPTFEEMETRLLDDLTPTPEDWVRLSRERAERVRQALLEPGRVELERVLVEDFEGHAPSGTKVVIELE